MFKHLVAITTATFIALAIAPANATHKDGAPHGDMGPPAETLVDSIATLLNLLEPKTIFVTSTAHDGKLDGLEGADTICQGLADGIGSIVPEGEYVALLSTDEVNAFDRITPCAGPYIRPGGGIIAADFAALFSAFSTSLDDDHNLIDSVDTDETGATVDAFVWTDTLFTGETFGLNCINWTSNSSGDSGQGGETMATNRRWLFAPPPHDCNIDAQHLYCVQQ